MKNTREPDFLECKTLWIYFREGLRRANARRPASFYLLLAIPVALVLGAHILEMRDNPRQFVFYMALFFGFFFVVLHRAIVDFIEIARRHFFDSEALFRTTLGETEFVTRLGESVDERRQP